MATQMGGRLDVPRALLCVCGWGGRVPNGKAAGWWVDRHLADAGDGGDHAVEIMDDGGPDARVHRRTEPRMA